MQATGKTFGRKLSEMPSNVGLKEKEQQESLENLFKQALGKEALFALTRTAEFPIQWIHLLEPFHHQNVCNGSKGLNVDCGHEKGSGSESSHDAASCFKDNSNSRMKGNGGFGRTAQEGRKEIPPLRLPEAMVALAQAAAKSNGLSGWSFMSPFKVQMQKCEKCSTEFFSPLNFRRHMRLMHRRSLSSEKDDFSKERGQLVIFWDKLTPEVASSIVASQSLILEDLSGEAIVRALTSVLQQPSLSSLPRSYMKAGQALLKLIQNKSSKLASRDLLDLLDESSEKTFLSVASGSNDRYTFEGGAKKVGLECKNLVAALGYLVERNLVKAWMEDKDAEAWRCQRALEEEETASQKLLAEIQERKRLKKVRQKELKDKERKFLDPTMGQQSLEMDPMDGENMQGNREVEDSSSDLQSSHLLSTLSGQCGNGDSYKSDRIEFETYAGKYENLYDRLADEGSEIDKFEHATSNKSSDFPQEKKINEENSQTVLVGAGAFGPEETSKKLAETGCLQEAGCSERTNIQNKLSKETIKLPMDSKMLATGRIVPAQKFKETWEYGKHFRPRPFRSYPKSSSFTELGCNGLNQEEKQRASRKLSGMEGQSLQEFPRAKTNQNIPGYFHQGKLHGNRSFTSYKGAVWTKKVRDNSNAQINELSEDVESAGVCRDLIEGPLSENSKLEGTCISGQADTTDASSCESVQDSSDCENDVFEVKASCDTRCDLLSASNEQLQVSDSGSCQLFEISDKVEASGNYDKDSSLTDVSSFEDLEDRVMPYDTVQSLECSTCQRHCECQSTKNVSDHSLVIGSVSVPLGKASANSCDAVHTASPNEVTKSSQGMNYSHCINHQIETLYDGEGKGSGRLHQESLGALQENGYPSSGFRKESLKYPSQVDPECKENHEQINPEAMGLERLTKSAPWSNATLKVGSTKVWRPVGVAGRNSTEIVGNGSKFGVPYRKDHGNSPSIGRDNQDNDMANIADHGNDGRDSVDKNMEICEFNTTNESKEGGYEGACGEGLDENEGLLLRQTLSLETDSDDAQVHASEEDNGELTGVILNNAVRSLSSKFVASFLSQRWIDAVTTPESLLSSMHKEKNQNPEIIMDIVDEINTSNSIADKSLAGNTQTVISNDTKSSFELSTIAVTGNTKFRAKERWHQKSKSGRLELRYVPK